MGKNNKLINSLNEIARRNREEQIKQASEKDTPQIYAVMSMALYRLLDSSSHDDKIEMINSVIAESQDIWLQAVESGSNVLDLCEDETGIKFEYKRESV